MKTDLAKILSVSGYHGLFRYLAPARSGALGEALEDGKRLMFPATAHITSLEDIAIYTNEGELKLRDVFLALAKTLDGKQAPTSKASVQELKDLFAKAVPDYDGSRFYLSHMKKVVDWYNELQAKASLDFVTDEDREKEAENAK